MIVGVYKSKSNNRGGGEEEQKKYSFLLRLFSKLSTLEIRLVGWH